jgi:hypothetical protein
VGIVLQGLWGFGLLEKCMVLQALSLPKLTRRMLTFFSLGRVLPAYLANPLPIVR